MSSSVNNTIPQGNWLEADGFRRLVKEIVPLRPDGWSLAEFERAIAVLGWEIGEPAEVGDMVWRRFLPRKGPMGGYGKVTSDASEPERIRKLSVPVVDIESEDVRTAADEVRAAWWIMEEELGPPTTWGGLRGPWMLWRRPGTSIIVHSHDEGLMDLELVPTEADLDAAARSDSRGSWRAADPAHLPPALAAPARPSTRWDEVQQRLAQALRSLNEDTPFFPGAFILHLGSAHDPQRFVQCWSDGLDLVLEATGYVHHPEPADPAGLAERGWELSHSLWQRRFRRAMQDRSCSTTAARMLVGELQNLGVDLADLVYDGTVSGRGQGFHLDLPQAGLRRSRP